MVQLTMTAAMVEALDFCRKNEISGWPSCPIDKEPPLDSPQIGNPVSHGQVIELSKCLGQYCAQTRDGTRTSDVSPVPDFHLDTLLRGSHVYIEPPKPKPEPTSEYKALMARLRKEEEAKSYQRMIDTSSHPNSGNIQLGGDIAASEEDEMTFSDINRQIALICNVLLSVVACSIALWMVARHWSAPTRLGLSMSGGGLVGIAEVVIYAGYLRRLSEAKQKEKRKAEKKEIFETWVIESSQGDEQTIRPKRSATDLRRRAALPKKG